ncbi:MAG TPA: AtpZ/AtpI family protein [Deltaproteobacteria bacterium]|nr:AtpZ/AtpI family protein [Candidatus Binatota bacterium]HIL14192.1 AtpZ/AtpI family protein [Deltaproteobacteria bacterium]
MNEPGVNEDRGGSLKALGLGWSLGWRVVAGALLGYLADAYLGSGPWLALLGGLGAMVSGVRNMLSVLGPDPAQDSSLDPGSSDEGT